MIINKQISVILFLSAFWAPANDGPLESSPLSPLFGTPENRRVQWK